MERRVVTVLTCANWPTLAEVLVTECGHRHVRAKGTYVHGSLLFCPFCEEREEFPPAPRAPDIGPDVPGGGAG